LITCGTASARRLQFVEYPLVAPQFAILVHDGVVAAPPVRIGCKRSAHTLSQVLGR